ncbi:MAG: glutathione S-transferase [Hyphomonadaceae bacterium]
MITIHHLNNSRSQRVLWLLEELGVPYEVKRYERDPKTMQAPPALKQVHPLGKSPVLTEDGRTIAETGPIMEYVIERHGGGQLIPPQGSDERLRYTYWMHYAEGSAMTPLLLKLVFMRLPMGAPAPIRGFAKMISAAALKRLVEPQLTTHIQYWEDELGKSPWFAGSDFSAADIMMSFPLEAAAARAGAAQKPRIAVFLETIHARPAYKRALERGGQYDYAS